MQLKITEQETQGLLDGRLRRLIGYVQQIKSFHRDQKWDICLNMYQVLRSSLADIRARLPEPAARHRMTLKEAIDPEHERRIARLREEMEREGVDGLYLTQETNVRYASAMHDVAWVIHAYFWTSRFRRSDGRSEWRHCRHDLTLRVCPTTNSERRR